MVHGRLVANAQSVLGDSTGEPAQQLHCPGVSGAGLEGHQTSLSGGGRAFHDWLEQLESYKKFFWSIFMVRPPLFRRIIA